MWHRLFLGVLPNDLNVYGGRGAACVVLGFVERFPVARCSDDGRAPVGARIGRFTNAGGRYPGR
jgi:hypothetical protein